LKGRLLVLYGLLYSVLIALANNVDNIGVRIAYCIRGIKLGILQNLLIAVITFLISTLAAILGSVVSGAIGENVCKFVSMGLLVCIGLWFATEPFLKKRKKLNAKPIDSIMEVLKNPEESDLDNSKSIDFKEATLLGISLSINNVGGSLSGGMIGLNAILIGVLSAVVSFLALFAGNYLTYYFVRLKLGDKATIISGAILIIIGIKQIL
jgi:putative sporulation protein YtaF